MKMVLKRAESTYEQTLERGGSKMRFGHSAGRSASNGAWWAPAMLLLCVACQNAGSPAQPMESGTGFLRRPIPRVNQRRSTR
jgi:hypothetical protein